MIDRYQVSSIATIWADENKYSTWAYVEQLVCAAWHKLGLISDEEFQNIKTNLKVNIDRMKEIEQETKHDVVAFTRMLSESLGPEKRWIHYGLTSTDVVDTSQNYLIKQSNIIVSKELTILLERLLNKAQMYRHQIILGRTHGMFAEPTSLGLKFLLWYKEAERCYQNFTKASEEIAVVKISGSVGNFAHVELEVEEYVAYELGLKVDPINTQVTARDRHVTLFNSFAKTANLLEKIALELRHFHRSEINEIAEGFEPNQKGSSSMPHKKNPISAENISGLARLIRSYSQVTYENNLLWHERDISHSSNERIIIPDSFHLIVYILQRMNSLLKNLVVNEQQIMLHLTEAKNIYFSQVILNAILRETKISREEAYDFIQNCTLLAQEKNEDFKIILLNQGVEKYLSEEKLDQLFNINYFVRNVDKIYHKVLGEE